MMAGCMWHTQAQARESIGACHERLQAKQGQPHIFLVPFKSAFLTSAAYFRASTERFPREACEAAGRSRPGPAAPLPCQRGGGRRPGEGVSRLPPHLFHREAARLSAPGAPSGRGEQGGLGVPAEAEGGREAGLRRKKTWRGRSERKCDNKSEIKGRRRLSLLCAFLFLSLRAG